MNCVQQSITKKWEPILRGKHKEQSVYDCPCCRKYYDYDECAGCPIASYTGFGICLATPYAIFCELKIHFFHHGNVDLHAELTACAQWEIDFLREVLEAGE